MSAEREGPTSVLHRLETCMPYMMTDDHDPGSAPQPYFNRANIYRVGRRCGCCCVGPICDSLRLKFRLHRSNYCDQFEGLLTCSSQFGTNTCFSRHRCPHHPSGVIHKGDKVCLLSEYKNKYNAYPIDLRKSCKPEYEPMQGNEPLADETTNR